MMKSFTVRTCIAVVMATSGIAVMGPATMARANTSWVEVYACPKGISIFAVEDDLNLPAPTVDFKIIGTNIGGTAGNVGSLTGAGVPGDGKGRQFVYWSDVQLQPGQKGEVRARGARNESYAKFTVDGDCPPLGSVRGSAFEDFNRNGTRDPGEPGIGTASWKVTGGGDWFLCGYVGGDSTYGPTVKPGTYVVIPIAQPGWRATTPVRTALVKRLGEAALNNDLGFVRAPNASGDNCSGYAPPGNLLPPAGPLDSLTTLQNFGVFNTLVSAINTAGLGPTLAGPGPFTILAPGDVAFSKLSATTQNRLANFPGVLTELLKCHVIVGNVDVSKLNARGQTFQTLGKQKVTLRVRNGMLYANNAIVGEVSKTSNGAVFVLDRVLFVR
jgi:hypothetical protein